MEITGKVIAILPLREGSNSNGGWKSQDFVVETTGQYPKKVCLNLFGDKVGLMPNINEDVTASIEVESREYNEKWFTTVRVWKLVKNGAQTPQQATNTVVEVDSADDGLPF